MRRLLGLLLVPLLAGCFQTTFVNPSVSPGEEHDPWTHFFLWGLVGEAEMDVRELCSGDVYSVGFGQNFGTYMVSLVTLGIYTPRKIYVTCAENAGAPAMATIETDASGKPVRVTRLEGGRVFEGLPEPVPGEPGRYRVALVSKEVR